MKKLLREFWDKKIFEGLSEILYHSSRSPILNLKNNELIASPVGGDEFLNPRLSKDHFWFISTARSATSSYFGIKNIDILFELDGKKLQNISHGKAHDYFFGIQGGNTELEDRIYLKTNKLKNLNKYLRRIIVPVPLGFFKNGVLLNPKKILEEGFPKFGLNRRVSAVLAAIDYMDVYDVKIDFVKAGKGSIFVSRSRTLNFDELKEFFLELSKELDLTSTNLRVPEKGLYSSWVDPESASFINEQSLKEIYTIYSIFYLVFLGWIPKELEKYLTIERQNGIYYYSVSKFSVYIYRVPRSVLNELFIRLKEMGARNPSEEEVNRILLENFSWPETTLESPYVKERRFNALDIERELPDQVRAELDEFA